jgi:hypothetical protein
MRIPVPQSRTAALSQRRMLAYLAFLLIQGKRNLLCVQNNYFAFKLRHRLTPTVLFRR